MIFVRILHKISDKIAISEEVVEKFLEEYLGGEKFCKEPLEKFLKYSIEKSLRDSL